MARWGGEDARTAAEIRAHVKGVPRTYDVEKMLERLAEPEHRGLRERLAAMYVQATYEHWMPAVVLERLRPTNVERIPDHEAKFWYRKFCAAVMANKGVFFHPDDAWQRRWDTERPYDLHLSAGVEAARKEHEEALDKLADDDVDEEAQSPATAAGGKKR